MLFIINMKALALESVPSSSYHELPERIVSLFSYRVLIEKKVGESSRIRDVKIKPLKNAAKSFNNERIAPFLKRHYHSLTQKTASIASKVLEVMVCRCRNAS